MERRPVDSSNLVSVGYDADRQLLEIEFHAGGVYRYHPVPEEEVNRLLSARSIGGYFHEHIRDNYETEKVA